MNILNLKKISQLILNNYNSPINFYFVYWFKFIIGILYLWKLLSRDFSNIALWPVSVISGYPVDIYHPDYLLFMGIAPFFDLVTFHFIHYFISYPSEGIFSLLQNIAIFLSILLIFSPLRYSRITAIFLYFVVSYLWGFVFRLGQEIDAVFLIQSSLLVYALLPFENSFEYCKKLRFLALVVFVIYYFFSGLNKIVDLSYVEWFKFDLVNINSSFHLKYLLENLRYTPELPSFTKNGLFYYILNDIGSAITYIVHLLFPLLLLYSDTKKILIAWFFYTMFHFLTIYVGILFSMNFLAWLIILPVYRWGFKNDKK
ncbi:hypothetical protein [Candidatus Pelagibacter bacterium nBUS_28]|uniref:hypothetical protein n=1 Tax=Candidatus Pelagibacter bacterium nBUS_28 TaxID=3374189 RepID=UPI003EBA091C